MKGFTIEHKAAIHVYSKPVSMCYGFPKLRELAGKLEKEEKDLYVFCNQKRNYLKVLFWAKDGWCIFAKKLEKKGGATFDVNLAMEEDRALTQKELTQIVDQVVIYGAKKGRKLDTVKKAA